MSLYTFWCFSCFKQKQLKGCNKWGEVVCFADVCISFIWWAPGDPHTCVVQQPTLLIQDEDLSSRGCSMLWSLSQHALIYDAALVSNSSLERTNQHLIYNHIHSLAPSHEFWLYSFVLHVHIKLVDSWLREKILFQLGGGVSSSHSEWEWKWKVIDFEVLWHACVLSVYNLIKSQLKGGGGVLAVHIKASNINCIVCMGIVRTVWLPQLSGWAMEAQALDFCQLFSFVYFHLTDIKQVSVSLAGDSQ